MRLVHRVAWELKHGPLLPGQQVLHRCDSPPCCNYDHLYVGGYAENAEDCSTRGRRSSGKVVTREMVQLIRARHKSGVSQYRLSREFGLSGATIQAIVYRRTWRHLTDPA
jgi:hypothetical protein